MPSPEKPNGRNIYLSSKIDGAIDVLKRSKEKEEESSKLKQKKAVTTATPDLAKVRLASLFADEKKY